ncbi:MAG: ABC transporter permease [Candidatus Hodarchaeales archaeon]
MLILDITLRLLKEVLRLKIALVVLLGMPAFMGFMFAFAFGASGLGEAETYTIGIINNDDGLGDELANYLRSDSILLTNLPFNETTIDNGFAVDFIDILNTSTYQTDEEKSEKRIFTVLEYNNQEIGQKAVEERQIDALIVFPENYSNTTVSAFNNAFYFQNNIYIHNMSYPPLWYYNGPPFPINENSEIVVIGDEGYTRYQITSIILDKIFSIFNEEIKALNYSGGNIDFSLKSVTLEEYSLFDTIFPGILVFASLTQAGMLAAFLVGEFAETKTIARVRLSLIKPYEYIAGVTIYAFLISLLQLSILLVFALVALDFNPAGNIIEAMIVLLLTTLFTTALGFLLAGIFKSSDTAGQSAGFLMTPLAFMSGAFMEAPAITILPKIFPTASGLPRDFILWDLLPSTHAVNALRSILLYEFSIFEVWADVVFVVIPSLILLILSMIFYTKRRFRGDIPN